MQSVAYPCLEPLILLLVNFFEARKATDYLEKSADMIIEARKMESNDSAKVSMYIKCIKKHTHAYIAAFQIFWN